MEIDKVALIDTTTTGVRAPLEILDQERVSLVFFVNHSRARLTRPVSFAPQTERVAIERTAMNSIVLEEWVVGWLVRIFYEPFSRFSVLMANGNKLITKTVARRR